MDGRCSASKGFVNSVLMGLGVIARAAADHVSPRSRWSIGIIAVNLPFMVLTLQSVIEGIDRAVEEAAFSLGARPVADVPSRAVAARACRA